MGINKELDVDNAAVRKLFSKRWRRHPECRNLKSEADCWQRVLEDRLVTPDSQSRDPQLEKVFSNYPI